MLKPEPVAFMQEIILLNVCLNKLVLEKLPGTAVIQIQVLVLTQYTDRIVQSVGNNTKYY